VAAAALLALVGYGMYNAGSLLIDVFGLVYALLVLGGTVLVCVVADHVAPRADGGSWFWTLFELVMVFGDDDD